MPGTAGFADTFISYNIVIEEQHAADVFTGNEGVYRGFGNVFHETFASSRDMFIYSRDEIRVSFIFETFIFGMVLV